MKEKNYHHVIVTHGMMIVYSFNKTKYKINNTAEYKLSLRIRLCALDII